MALIRQYQTNSKTPSYVCFSAILTYILVYYQSIDWIFQCAFCWWLSANLCTNSFKLAVHSFSDALVTSANYIQVTLYELFYSVYNSLHHLQLPRFEAWVSLGMFIWWLLARHCPLNTGFCVEGKYVHHFSNPSHISIIGFLVDEYEYKWIYECGKGNKWKSYESL